MKTHVRLFMIISHVSITMKLIRVYCFIFGGQLMYFLYNKQNNS